MFEWYDRQMQNPDHQMFSQKLLILGLSWLSLNSILKSRPEYDACIHTAAEIMWRLPATVTLPGPFYVLNARHWPVSSCGGRWYRTGAKT